MEYSMTTLYHGTLAKYIKAIRDRGLVPQRGELVKAYDVNAPDLVYAVDENRKGRLMMIIAQQMKIENLVPWSDSDSFTDFQADLSQHGAVLALESKCFILYSSDPTVAHPTGPEEGDWYSRKNIRADSITDMITGQRLLSWLKPHREDFKVRVRPIFSSAQSSG
jgi:hypothetical protein